MASCRVLPVREGARLIAQAFKCRGVNLKHPAHSRSGLRDGDGVVVFAMPESRVRVNDWGCSCPLWLPSDARGGQDVHAAISREKLQHCMLAVRLGMAEGFLLDAHEVPAASTEVLTLHVMKLGAEYWATWGGIVRARWSREDGVAAGAPRAQSARGGG